MNPDLASSLAISGGLVGGVTVVILSKFVDGIVAAVVSLGRRTRRRKTGRRVAL